MSEGRLPDFVIAGAQKCGTTTLHFHLAAHPAVHLPPAPQEIHFFDIDSIHARGAGWYRGLFAGAGPGTRAVGQTCPTYLYEPAVAGRMAGLLPDARLLFVLRNPVERAHSHYWHSVKYGLESLPFEAALEREGERIAGSRWDRLAGSYVDRGRYARQLEGFLEHYPRERLLLLLTEELRSDPAGTLDLCFDFLGVERRGEAIVRQLPRRNWNPSRLPRSRALQALTSRLRTPERPRLRRLARLVDRVNLREADYPPLQPATRAQLEATFADDNRRLAERFGLDLSPWYKGAP